jgi:DNA-binding transcriptional MerR regulator
MRLGYSDRICLFPRANRLRLPHLRDLKFVRHAQELGFSLTEIRELLALREKHYACSEVQSLLKHKLAGVREKIQSLANWQRSRSSSAVAVIVAVGC